MLCTTCERTFPLQAGIVSLLPSAGKFAASESAEVDSERRQRDQEAGLYDRLLALRLLSLLEIPATLGALRLQPADRLVEVGCGTGRITLPIAHRGCEVVALDHSLESLRILRAKLDRLPGHRVLLVQGDATALPIRSGWATRALSSQVIEHLPTERLRGRLVEEMARILEADGRLALSGYRDWPLLRRFLPREGHHSGTIYFHRFAPDELRGLLEPRLKVERITSRLIYVLLAQARKRKEPEC